MTKKLEAAINKQINEEIWSGYLYQSMSLHLAAEGYAGFANWFNIQAREEYDHARILMNYLISRGARVELLPIKEVKNRWKTPLEIAEDTLAHEKIVTSYINDLYTLSTEEKEYATIQMLQWFIEEQVEEEESSQELIDKLKLIGKDGSGLYMLDNELATRTYTQPTPLTGKLIK